MPNAVKAARYSNKFLGNDYEKGESVKWLFINGVPEGQPQCNVIAFNEIEQLDEYVIDWSTCVTKWITAKLKLVYETLDWDVDRLTVRRIPRSFESLIGDTI